MPHPPLRCAPRAHPPRLALGGAREPSRSPNHWAYTRPACEPTRARARTQARARAPGIPQAPLSDAPYGGPEPGGPEPVGARIGLDKVEGIPRAPGQFSLGGPDR